MDIVGIHMPLPCVFAEKPLFQQPASAGHVIELVGMRPSDTRYNVSPFGKPHFGLATQPAMSIMSAFPLCDPPGS